MAAQQMKSVLSKGRRVIPVLSGRVSSQVFPLHFTLILDFDVT